MLLLVCFFKESLFHGIGKIQEADDCISLFLIESENIVDCMRGSLGVEFGK